MSTGTPTLNVHFLPQFVAQHELADSVVIVVDLLRASTTICHAFAAGVQEIIPFAEIDETWEEAKQHPRSEILLGGERGGSKIAHFDLGNSPSDYLPATVFGKTLLFTTTNGTRALRHASLGKSVLVGALVNLSALVAEVEQEDVVNILCAGTNGHVTREDILAAGAIVSSLATRSSAAFTLSDNADRARGEWEELATAGRLAAIPLSNQVALELRDTPGGKNLIAIGYDADLEVCAQVDQLGLVPELDTETWRIRLR